MAVYSDISKAISNPEKIIPGIMTRISRIPVISDEAAIKLAFRAQMGYKLNLENPTTFNEKLQWLKLHDRNPLYTQLVDKIAVKQWVADRIGSEYVIPTYAVWNGVDEIDLDSLPSRFVLKTNHDSGGIAICRDKTQFDFQAAKKKLAASLKRNYFYQWREWPYKDVEPKVFAEAYLEDLTAGELPDYKYFCFDGKAKVMFVATERFGLEETKFDFYDMEFKHIPVTNGHPNSTKPLAKPDQFNRMKELAERLALGIPQVRVDFYETQSGIYFGEMTFSHWSGLVPFDPKSFDDMFGEWIELPEEIGGGVFHKQRVDSMGAPCPE